MNLTDIQQLAQDLMREHGVGHVPFRFDNGKRRAGCVHARRNRLTGEVMIDALSLSRHILPMWPEEEVRKVILHEIAHIIAGPTNHHNAKWRAVARSLGIRGDRCYSADLPTPPAAWTGLCPAGHEFPRTRRPSSRSSCPQHPGAKGFKPEWAITWHRTGPDLDRAKAALAQPAPVVHLVPTATPEAPTVAELAASTAVPVASIDVTPTRPAGGVPASRQESLF